MKSLLYPVILCVLMIGRSIGYVFTCVYELFCDVDDDLDRKGWK